MGLQEHLDRQSERADEKRRRLRGLRAALATTFLMVLALAPFLRAADRTLARERQIEAWRRARLGGGRIDVNRIERDLLETLPGIGPRQAGRILAWRRHVGPFRRLDDLSRVPGIGKNRVDQLRDLLRTEER